MQNWLTVNFLMSTSGVEGAEPDTDVRPLPAAEAPLPPTLDLSNTLGAFFVTTSSSCCNDQVEDKKGIINIGAMCKWILIVEDFEMALHFSTENFGCFDTGTQVVWFSNNT